MTAVVTATAAVAFSAMASPRPGGSPGRDALENTASREELEQIDELMYTTQMRELRAIGGERGVRCEQMSSHLLYRLLPGVPTFTHFEHITIRFRNTNGQLQRCSWPEVGWVKGWERVVPRMENSVLFSKHLSVKN